MPSNLWSLDERLSLLHAIVHYQSAQSIAEGLKIVYPMSPERSIDSIRWQLREIRELYGLGKAGDLDIPQARIVLQRELQLHGLAEKDISLTQSKISSSLMAAHHD